MAANMGTASITMSLDDFEAMKRHMAEQDKAALDLTAQLNEARRADPSGRVEQLMKLSRELITITQFAIANLPPEMTRGWPFKALVDAAKLIEHLPDHSPHDQVLAEEMVRFADECEEWATRRKNTPEVEVPPPFPIDQHPLVKMRAGIATPGSELPSGGEVVPEGEVG